MTHLKLKVQPTPQIMSFNLYFLCVQEKEIVKIQAFLKANKARDDYKTLSK